MAPTIDRGLAGADKTNFQDRTRVDRRVDRAAALPNGLPSEGEAGVQSGERCGAGDATVVENVADAANGRADCDAIEDDHLGAAALDDRARGRFRRPQ